MWILSKKGLLLLAPRRKVPPHQSAARHQPGAMTWGAMKKLLVCVALLAPMVCIVPTANAYEAGRRYGGFNYPNFPGYSLALSAWFNVDTVNDRIRGYGYTDPPNVSGFRSSAQSDMRYYVGCCGTGFVSGNRIYGFTERLTSSTPLASCPSATDYFSQENWQTTDAYDYSYQGAFNSNQEFLPVGCG